MKRNKSVMEARARVEYGYGKSAVEALQLLRKIYEAQRIADAVVNDPELSVNSEVRQDRPSRTFS